MPHRGLNTNDAGSGPQYLPLATLGIPFAPFPEEPSKSVASAVSSTPVGRGRSPATDRLPAGRRGVFVGQLPFGLTPASLAFAVNTVLGREAVRMVSVAHRQSCGWVCLDDDDAEEAFARSESALVEAGGVWVARDAAQHHQLNAFCAALKARKHGEEILKLQLPKATLTLKPTTPAPASNPASAVQQRGQQQQARNTAGRAEGVPHGAPPPPPPHQRQQQQQQQSAYSPQHHHHQHQPAIIPTADAQHHHHQHQPLHHHATVPMAVFSQHQQQPIYQQQFQPQHQQQQFMLVPAGPPDASGQQPMMLVPVYMSAGAPTAAASSSPPLMHHHQHHAEQQHHHAHHPNAMPQFHQGFVHTS